MHEAVPLVDLTANPPNWLLCQETRLLFSAIKSAGGNCRFVGGCVRDALLGFLSDDLDVGTDLEPEHVWKVLKAAGFKVVPTGLDHGTLTAISGTRIFEVTTLRIDTKTDGRHAEVSFTDSWEQDASRRDFTFNALSMSGEGQLFDYFSGLEDLSTGIVRFIGNGSARIEEDYLRILRYFRFLARFGHAPQDRNALLAIEEHAPSLSRLSKERVTKEIMLLLECERPEISLGLMQKHGVLKALFGVALYPDNVEQLAKTEDTINPIHRLLVLLGGDLHGAKVLISKLRLSNKTVQRILEACADKLPPDLTIRAQKEILFRLGRQIFEDQAIIGLISSGGAACFQSYLVLAKEWDIPELPIKGQDLLDQGLKPGPEIGQKLSQLTEYWIAQEFAPDRDGLLSQL